MSTWAESMHELWLHARTIWLSGGWAMIAIAIIALVLFGIGMRLHLKLMETGFRRVPESKWRRWLEDPTLRKGPVGELLNFAGDARTLKESSLYFDQLQVAKTKPFQRDLTVMKICVGAAPLLGLLGTVTGMLATFAALSSGSGGEKTMAMVAKGISEALITTETGLVIALPGLFFQYRLMRRFDGYKAFLAHMETVCTQRIYRKVSRHGALEASLR